MSEENPNRGTSLTFFALMWVVLFALTIAYFDGEISERKNPNSAPVSRQVGNQLEIALKRNSQGHFVSNGFVNNHEVVFIVDTGATDVVLGEQTARAAGLKRGRGGFANTAAGVVTVYSTTIDTLRVGDITLHNVEASINPHMDEEQALLGMAFCRRSNSCKKAIR